MQKVSDCYVSIFRPLQSGNQGHADNLSLPKRILKISKVKTSERLQVRFKYVYIRYIYRLLTAMDSFFYIFFFINKHSLLPFFWNLYNELDQKQLCTFKAQSIFHYFLGETRYSTKTTVFAGNTQTFTFKFLYYFSFIYYH